MKKPYYYFVQFCTRQSSDRVQFWTREANSSIQYWTQEPSSFFPFRTGHEHRNETMVSSSEWAIHLNSFKAKNSSLRSEDIIFQDFKFGWKQEFCRFFFKLSASPSWRFQNRKSKIHSESSSFYVLYLNDQPKFLCSFLFDCSIYHYNWKKFVLMVFEIFDARSELNKIWMIYATFLLKKKLFSLSYHICNLFGKT